MGNCAYPKCSNRNGKRALVKYRVFQFPKRDERRRNLWMEKCGLKHISSRATLCEGHFSISQFDVVDLSGKLELRRNAIPDICVPNPAPTASSENSEDKPQPTELCSVADLQQDVLKEMNIHVCTESTSVIKRNPNVPEVKNPGNKNVESLSLDTFTNPVDSLPQTVESMKKRIEQLISEKSCLLKKRRQDKKTIEALTWNLSKFLNEDQLEFLKSPNTSTHSKQWSEETMQKASQVWMNVGQAGYNYLLKNGYPLPSYATLCRRKLKVKGTPG